MVTVKTIWLKSVNILIAGLFLFQTSAYGWNYESYDTLPDYDWKADAVGFAATVGMSFVPAGANKMGDMCGWGTAGKTAAGVVMGAGVGATPGWVAHDGRAASYGAITGGIGGGVGSYYRAYNIATVNNELGNVVPQARSLGQPTDPSTTFGFGIGPGGPGSYNYAVTSAEQGSAFFQAGNYDIAAEKFGDASKSFGCVSKGWPEQGIPHSAEIGALGKRFGEIGTASSKLSLQSTWDNIRTSVVAQQIGSSLTSAGTLCWGMEPKDAQFMGMVGGSVAGWTMAADTKTGKTMLGDMYKDINPPLEKYVENNPRGVGLITGLGLGSLQAGTQIYLYDKVFADDSMPDSARNSFASLGAGVLSNMAWGGLTGLVSGTLPDIQPSPSAIDSSPVVIDTLIVQEDMRLVNAAIARPEASIDTLITDTRMFNIDNLTTVRPLVLFQPGMPEVKGEPHWLTKLGAAFTAHGFGNGLAKTWDRTPWRSIAQQSLSTGIGWAAEHNWVKDDMDTREKLRAQTHASIFGDSMGMLLSNLPLIPEGPKLEQAKILNASAESYAQREKAFRNKITESYDKGYEKYIDPLANFEAQIVPQEPDFGPVVHNPVYLQRNLWETEADKWANRAEKTFAQAKKLEGWHAVSLREPTPITKNTAVDRVLEPAISGLSKLAVSSLRESARVKVAKAETEAARNSASFDLLIQDLTVMNVSQISHAGLVSLFNHKGWGEGGGEGWNEFGQIILTKQYEFSSGLLPFSGLEKRKLESREEREKWGGSSLYGAAQINSGLWNFTGLSNFAPQAECIRKQLRGTEFFNNWRQKAALSLPGSPGISVSGTISNLSGGRAYSQAIRDMEGLAYSTLKNTVTPYDLKRVNPNLAETLEVKAYENPKYTKLGDEVNKWIKQSAYPALGTGPNKVVQFKGWTIGDETIGAESATKRLTLENAMTGMKYPLESNLDVGIDMLDKTLDVNKPFKLVFPETRPAVIFPPVSHVGWSEMPYIKEAVIEHETRSLVLPVERSPLPLPLPLPGKTRVIEHPIEKVEEAFAMPRFNYPIEGGTCFPEGKGIEDAGAQVSSPDFISEPYHATVYDVPIEGGVYTSNGSTIPDTGDSTLYNEMNYPTSPKDNSYDFEGGTWNPDTHSTHQIDEMVKQPKIPVSLPVKKEAVKPVVPQPVYIPETPEVTAAVLSEASLAQIGPAFASPAPAVIEPDTDTQHTLVNTIAAESFLTPILNRTKNSFFQEYPKQVIALGPKEGDLIVYEQRAARKGSTAYTRTLFKKMEEGSYKNYGEKGSVFFLEDQPYAWTYNDIVSILRADAEKPLKTRPLLIASRAVSKKNPSTNKTNAYGWSAINQQDHAEITVSVPRFEEWEENLDTFMHEEIHASTPYSLGTEWNNVNQRLGVERYANVKGLPYAYEWDWEEQLVQTIIMAVNEPVAYAQKINEGGRYGAFFRDRLELSKENNLISERQYNRVIRYVTPVVLEPMPMMAEPQYSSSLLNRAIDR